MACGNAFYTMSRIDHLLEEILVRLPHQSAVRCKSVSRHWLALISRPDFLPHLRLARLQNQQMEADCFFVWNPCYLMIIAPHVTQQSEQDSRLLGSELSLDFLGPDFHFPEPDPPWSSQGPLVFGYCNGLQSVHRGFHEAPSAAGLGQTLKPTLGFVSEFDPHYNLFAEKRRRNQTKSICTSFSTQVLWWCASLSSAVRNSSSMWSCSPPRPNNGVHLKQWPHYPFAQKKPVGLTGAVSATMGDCTSGDNRCTGTNKKRCHSLDYPANRKYLAHAPVLGLVRAFEWSLNVWELKEDYATGTRTWSLLHQMNFESGALLHPNRVIALHPHDENIVYLSYHGIVSCDLLKKTLNPVHRSGLNPSAGRWLLQAFQVVLPWWRPPVSQG